MAIPEFMIHQRVSDSSRVRFIRARATGRSGVPMRLLALSIGLSVLGVGLVGLLSSQFENHRVPLSVGDAVRSAEGARVLVRGLLGDIKPVGGGAALSNISDCSGLAVTVFFEKAPPPQLSWHLVALDARVQVYKGTSEFVVAGPAQAEAVAEGAAVVDADALSGHWRGFLCRAVAVHAPVLRAEAVDASGKTVEVALATNGTELRVLAHADVYLEVTLNPGASVTFVGVVAASEDGRSPVIHVRV